MSSKRRQRRKSCEHKRPYPTFAAADREACWQSRLSWQWIIAYRCRFGHHFHIGHPPRRIRQAIKAVAG